MRWTADPPRFAEYVRDVRVTRAGPLLYLYANLGVKRLPFLGQPTVEAGVLVIEFWPADPHSEPYWGELGDAEWPDVPNVVRLRVDLGEEGTCVLAEAGKSEVFLLVVLGPREGLVGEVEVERGPSMPRPLDSPSAGV